MKKIIKGLSKKAITDVVPGVVAIIFIILVLVFTEVGEDKFTKQKFQTIDDWVSGSRITDEYTDEEVSWSEVAGSPFSGYDTINYIGDTGKTNLVSGVVRKDLLTGLWWTDRSTRTLSNIFTLGTDGQRPTGGHAISFCDALNSVNFGGHNDWYLPTQKELLQAYIDGSANALPSSTEHYFWSSTERSWNSDRAWAISLYTSHSHYNFKLNSYFVRCVRR